MKSLFALLFAASLALASAEGLFPFQLPWDDASPGVADVSWLNKKPAGRDGFVRVKEGRLYVGDERLRIFGVNVCFGANFPEKAMAGQVAARLAKFGVNCVRFHHMDMFHAPSGIFAQDGRSLDAGQLDRLDYFIAELNKQGIYANLNLHVSRTYPDRPKAEKNGNPEYDKGVDNFCAAMIALQKEYARDLLLHVNPYTGNAYAVEPAVALVEINNENALGFQWFAGQMDALPKPYAAEFSERWSAWLKRKYGALERVLWREGAQEAGDELLGKPSWSFESHGTARVKGVTREGGVAMTVEQGSEQSWHAQFSAATFAVEAGRLYDFSARVKAPQGMRMTVNLMQSRAPWKVLGSATVKVGTEWSEVRALLRASEGDGSARVTFSEMGQTLGTWEMEGASLRGAEVRGKPQVVDGRAQYVRKGELAGYTQGAQRDWQEFLWETEREYWNGMRDFLNKELGVRAPIIGTQGFWSPGHVQAGMDVIDSHAYWQHPDFGDRGWNAEHWTVGNVPMAGQADGGTLPQLAAQRVAGKPFVCTEYNHAAPNGYGAETFPLLCAFAAAQDWDGVFAFSYSHRGGDAWGQEHFNNFFDIDRHPVKMATLPGAVVSFRRGDVKPAQGIETIATTRNGGLARALQAGPGNAPYLWGKRRAFPWGARSAYEIVAEGVAEGGTAVGAESAGGMVWMEIPASARIASPRSMAVVGRAGDESIALNPGPVIIQPMASRKQWASYQLTVLDRDERADFSTAKTILLTATGDIENTEMRWKNAEKTTVGRDWGKAPVLVEGPSARIILPGGTYKAWALDERGQRRVEVPTKEGSMEIGPQWRTLWYEIERL